MEASYDAARYAQHSDVLARCWSVIDNGEFTWEGWSDEGDAESGPRGGRLAGFNHEGADVRLTRNGSVTLHNGPDFALVYCSDGINYPRSAHALAAYLRLADELEGDPHEKALEAARERVADRRGEPIPASRQHGARDLDQQEVDALNMTERVRTVRGHGINE